MNHSTEEPSIEYGIYLASQADAVAAILADVFPLRDPLALAVGLTSSEFEPFVRTLLPMAAEERLTIVARLASTGEIVGAMLTNDPARETAEGMETLSEKFGPIGSILGELVATYRAGREPRPGGVGDGGHGAALAPAQGQERDGHERHHGQQNQRDDQRHALLRVTGGGWRVAGHQRLKANLVGADPSSVAVLRRVEVTRLCSLLESGI